MHVIAAEISRSPSVTSVPSMETDALSQFVATLELSPRKAPQQPTQLLVSDSRKPNKRYSTVTATATTMRAIFLGFFRTSTSSKNIVKSKAWVDLVVNQPNTTTRDVTPCWFVGSPTWLGGLERA